jgi:integrase
VIYSASTPDIPPQLIATDGSERRPVANQEDESLVSVLGYKFLRCDDMWKLSKDNSLNMAVMMERTPVQYRDSVRKLLGHYATTMSAGSTIRVSVALHGFFSSTSGEITTLQLINFKSGLGDNQEKLQCLRPFFKRWLAFGYPGVARDIVEMLDGWRLKGREKGLAIKSLDPNNGPLSDFEYASFNDHLVFSYENGEISLYDFCACLLIGTTGRRPIQLTHLKCRDLIAVKGKDGVRNYFLHIPRAKQEGGEFREDFKTYQLTMEMWQLLESHKQKVLRNVKALDYKLSEDQEQLFPLFPAVRNWLKPSSKNEFVMALQGESLHIRTSVFTHSLKRAVESLGIVSERTNDLLNVFARRFRYSLGTRAAREGISKYVIAELLDHSDTQHADVYTLNVPEHLKKIDEALGFQLAIYAKAFTGVLVDSELDALRGSDPASRVKHQKCGVGTCGNFSFCGMNAPRPCYTCVSFQPWVDGPHEQLYFELLDERENLIKETGDLTIAAVLDRTIIAVAEVVRKCIERQAEVASE